MSVETTNSLHNAYGLHSRFKLKTCLTKPRTSHLDACTSMEHAQIILQMSLTHLSEVFHARIVHNEKSLPYRAEPRKLLLFPQIHGYHVSQLKA
jgi:hypothetical protein